MLQCEIPPKEVVEGAAQPLYIYADRADRGDASAS
jgi:hypothetical protein